MTEKDFWKLYNEKYDGHMYISVLNEPLTLPPNTESINKIVSIAKEVILNVKKGQS